MPLSIAAPARLLITALVMLVAVADVRAIENVVRAAQLRTFRGHRHLQCSGCECLAAEVGRRMNATKANNIGRLVRAVPYERSDARAADVLDMLCDDVVQRSAFALADGPSHEQRSRIFAVRHRNRHYTKHVPLYTRRERDALHPVSNKLRAFCDEFLELFEDVVTAAVKSDGSRDDVVTSICAVGSGVCDLAYMGPHIAEEIAARKRFIENAARDYAADHDDL